MRAWLGKMTRREHQELDQTLQKVILTTWNMAVISAVLNSIWSSLPILTVTLVLLYFIHNYFKAGLVCIPGPFLAKITHLWRFIDVANGHAETTLYDLHQKHGDYVRLGPNVVSVRNLDALKTIYGINKGYRKVCAGFKSC